LSVIYARRVSRKYVLYYLKQKEHQAIILGRTLDWQAL